VAKEVLSLLWDLAHGKDVPLELCELALASHAKVLGAYHIGDAQRREWAKACMEDIQAGVMVVPALGQLKRIGQLVTANRSINSMSVPPWLTCVVVADASHCCEGSPNPVPWCSAPLPSLSHPCCHRGLAPPLNDRLSDRLSLHVTLANLILSLPFPHGKSI